MLTDFGPKLRSCRVSLILASGEYGNLQIVRILLDKFKLHVSTSIIREALKAACAFQHIDIVRELTNFSDNLLPNSMNLLLDACRKDDMCWAQQLVEAFSLENVASLSTNPNPFEIVCTVGNMEMVKYLAEGRSIADIEFHIANALKAKNFKLLAYLINHPSGHNIDRQLVNDMFVFACRKAEAEFASKLLDIYGMDVFMKAGAIEAGQTASYLTTVGDNYEMSEERILQILRILLNIPIEWPESQQIMATIKACNCGYALVVQELILYNPRLDLNPSDILEELRPMAASCRSGNAELVRYLLKQPSIGPVSRAHISIVFRLGFSEIFQDLASNAIVNWLADFNS